MKKGPKDISILDDDDYDLTNTETLVHKDFGEDFDRAEGDEGGLLAELNKIRVDKSVEKTKKTV